MRRPLYAARGLLPLGAIALVLVAAGAVALALSRSAGAQARGKIVLAWHAGFASRWLDPQEHDGTATPDNFFTALHDGLIKNQGTQLYDHAALAERFAVAPDADSHRMSARYLLSHHTAEGAARFLSMVDFAVLRLCEPDGPKVTVLL